MDNIIIQLAEESDLYEVRKFFANHFLAEEPINCAHPDEEVIEFDDLFPMNQINDGCVLGAFDLRTNTLVGIMIGEVGEPGDEERSLERSKNSQSKKEMDISMFLAYIEKKSDIYNRFNIKKSFHIMMVAVHSNYQNQGIAKKLFEFSFELAKQRNLKVVFADCTNIYTSKIAEKIGMEVVSNVTFDEYNKYLGTNLFASRPPHNAIRTFVKKIE